MESMKKWFMYGMFTDFISLAILAVVCKSHDTVILD